MSPKRSTIKDFLKGNKERVYSIWKEGTIPLDDMLSLRFDNHDVTGQDAVKLQAYFTEKAAEAKAEEQRIRAECDNEINNRKSHGELSDMVEHNRLINMAAKAHRDYDFAREELTHSHKSSSFHYRRPKRLWEPIPQ